MPRQSTPHYVFFIALALCCWSSSATAEPQACKDLAACTKACDGGEAPKCVSAARLLLLDKSEPANREAALLFNKACDLGQESACVELGRWREGYVEECLGTVTPRGVAKDRKEAARLYERACTLGFSDGCDARSQMASDPDVARKYKQLHVDYVREGCERGTSADCFAWASMFVHGNTIISADQERSISLYQTLCEAPTSDAWSKSACGHVEATCRRNQIASCPIDLQLERYEENCADGQGEFCNIAGMIHMGGRGVSRNTARGWTLVEEACRVGHGQSCYTLGAHHQYDDSERAVEYYQRSCDLGSTDGCGALSKILSTGHRVPADLERAGHAAARICTTMGREVCYQLAEFCREHKHEACAALK